jgi:hypothetical protein
MIANLPALPFKHSLKVPQQLSASHSGGTAPVDELVDFTVIGQDPVTKLGYSKAKFS